MPKNNEPTGKTQCDNCRSTVLLWPKTENRCICGFKYDSKGKRLTKYPWEKQARKGK